jgi:hypothetical protein
MTSAGFPSFGGVSQFCAFNILKDFYAAESWFAIHIRQKAHALAKA